MSSRKWIIILAASLALAAAIFTLTRRRPRSLNARDFVSGIPAIEPDMKLVVARISLVKTATAESRKDYWGFELGTTKVALSVPARVHYAIDLSGAAPVRFEMDSRLKTVTAVFPDPAVQSVEVFARDKHVVTEVGWGRLEAFSGRSVAEGLERGLYDAIKAEASAPRVIDEVKAKARQPLAAWVAAYLRGTGRRGMGVEIRFLSDAPAGDLETAMQ